jgi:Zn-dependent membrane protease YugP
MHPVLVLIPVAALILGPRFWVRRVLQRHNLSDEKFPLEAQQLAREMLDRAGLGAVAVEGTDIGDHYDPATKTVRLARDKYGRKTLTALTTAAHEVAHALQDFDAYPPFVWRQGLGRVAQVTGELGSVVLISVPAAALLTRTSVPPAVIGGTALAMFGTGIAAQLAAVPTELDASFGRALPLLREGHLDPSQAEVARKILFACSLTYLASSFASIVNIWPWIGRRPLGRPGTVALYSNGSAVNSDTVITPAERPTSAKPRPRRRDGVPERLVRKLAKPLIRSWLMHKHGQGASGTVR